MAQTQLSARYKVNNVFFIDLNGVTVKVWKKGKERLYATLKKPGTTQSLTLPMSVFKVVLDAQDVLLLASDFLEGLVGFSPADVFDETT